jgi:hypothetical protein
MDQPHGCSLLASLLLSPLAGNVVICGIMEHIEQAGVHSGDSACSIPTQSISEPLLQQIREWTISVAKELKVRSLRGQGLSLGRTIVCCTCRHSRASPQRAGA